MLMWRGWTAHLQAIRGLAASERLEMARSMKKRLNSSNKQIAQVLRLSLVEVERMFPRPV